MARTLQIVRNFGALTQDSLPQEAPANSLSDAVGIEPGRNRRHVFSSLANECCLSHGLTVRGAYHIEERDSFLVMGINSDGVGEIGVINYTTKKYCPIMTEKELDCPLYLNKCDWITITGQVFGNCSHLRIYFSVNKEFRVIDIDDPCRDWSDTKLLKARCVGFGRVRAVKGYGNLQNGAYMVSLKVKDQEGNDTNWGCYLGPVFVADEKCRQGEPTDWGLQITYNNLPIDYTTADLHVRELVDGSERNKLITDIGYGSGSFEYNYTGAEGTFQNNFSDALVRTPRYYRGGGIGSFDRRAVLWDTERPRNWNIQKYVSRARVRYRAVLVPMIEADKYPQLKRNENYDFGVRPLFTDGRKSDMTYKFINDNFQEHYRDIVAPGDGGNCSCCDQEKWMHSDTSIRETQCVVFEDGDSGGGVYQGEGAESQLISITSSYDEEVGLYNVSVNAPGEFNLQIGDHYFDSAIPEKRCISLSSIYNELSCSCVINGQSYHLNSEFTPLGSTQQFTLIPTNPNQGAADGIDNNITSNVQQGCSVNKCEDISSLSLTSEPCGENRKVKLSGFVGKAILASGPLFVEGEGELEMVVDCDGPYMFSVNIQNEDGCVYAGFTKLDSLEDSNSIVMHTLTELTNDQEECRLGDNPGESNSSEVLDINGGGFIQARSSSCGCLGCSEGGICVDPRSDDETEVDQEEEDGEDDDNENTDPPSWGGTFPTMEEMKEQMVYCFKDYTLDQDAINEWVDSVVDSCSKEDVTTLCGTCDNEGETKSVGGVTFECRANKWIATGFYTKNSDNPLRTGPVQGLPLTGHPYLSSSESRAAREAVGQDYVEDECYLKDTRPIKYSTGKFGFWETENRYPHIEVCNENGEKELVFGDWTGEKERIFKVPSMSKEPLFIARRKGVPYVGDPTNDPCNDAWAVVIAVSVDGLDFPAELKEEMCGFQIMMAHRAEKDKTVVGNGHLFGMFAGDIENEERLFFKNAVNSFEFYDWHVNVGGNSPLRRGRSTDIPAYGFHSADFHLWGNEQPADYLIVEQEQYGEGRRYGDYLEGDSPDNWAVGRCNYAGRRSASSLTNYKNFNEENQPIYRCIKAMDTADHDGYVDKSDKFSRSAVNLCRERIQYMELDEQLPEFTQDALGQYGAVGPGDGRSDNSFIGDTIDHEAFIPNVRTWAGTAMRYVPNQYGSIINRCYIPLGVNGDKSNIASGSIFGFGGDSWVGQFSIRRTACISDKVQEEIAEENDYIFTDDGFEEILDDAFDQFIPDDLPGPIKNLLEALKGIITIITTPFRRVFFPMFNCIEDIWKDVNCGTVPNSGEAGDVKNQSSLREGMRGMTSAASPIGAPSTDCPDSFYPHLLKHLIKTFQNSDANLRYRGTGNIIPQDEKRNIFGAAEVYAEKLDGLKLDPSMGGRHDNGFVSRFYFLMREASLRQIILRKAMRMLVICAFMVMLYVQGVRSIISGISALGGGGLATQTVGGILAIIFGIILILIAIWWGNFWTNGVDQNGVPRNQILKRAIDRLLKFEWCFPQIDFGQGGDGCRFAMDKKHAVQLEDNYFYYNIFYSYKNVEDKSFGVPPSPDFSWCPESSNVVLVSNRQNPESHLDSWSHFKVRHKFVVPSDRGKIMNVFDLNGTLYIHTTQTLFRVRFGQERLATDGQSIYLGRANLFSEPQDIFGGVVEGVAGLQDKNSAWLTPRGYFFASSKSRKWYRFNGSIQEISFTGLEEFMDCNMKFFLQDEFPDYNNRDGKCGIGYGFSINNSKDIAYFYKKDYKPKVALTMGKKGFYYKGKKVALTNSKYFQDMSFVIAYDLNTNTFISRHCYCPDFSLWNAHHDFSFKGKKMYTHDVKNKFNNFFDVDQPMFVEIPINIPSGYHKWFSVKKVIIIGDLLEYDDNGNFKEIEEKVVDEIQLLNGSQATPWISLASASDRANNDAIERMKKKAGEKKVSFDQNCLIIDNVKGDKVCPNEVYNEELKIYEPLKGAGQSMYLNDDYVKVRLVARKKINQKVVLRKIILHVEVDEDNILNEQDLN